MILNTEHKTDDVIIFIHLSKTGGTTLYSIINDQYGSNYIKETISWLFKNDLQYFEQIKDIDKEKISVLRGHLNFGVHKYLPHKKFTYITILRNPVERILSFYYYAQQNLDVFNKLKNVSLYDYMTNNEFNNDWFYTTTNYQTRKLSGTEEDDLKTAKENLEKYFSVVGTTERFDETVYVMGKKFNWKTNNYKKLNVTINRPTIEKIPDEVIEIIKAKNKKDIELHDFANNLLDNQLTILKNGL